MFFDVPVYINIWYFGGQLKNLLSLDLIVQQCYGDLNKWFFRLSANLPNQDVIKKANEIIFKIALNAFHQAVSPLSCLILIMFHKIAVKKHLQISGVISSTLKKDVWRNTALNTITSDCLNKPREDIGMPYIPFHSLRFFPSRCL